MRSARPRDLPPAGTRDPRRRGALIVGAIVAGTALTVAAIAVRRGGRNDARTPPAVGAVMADSAPGPTTSFGDVDSTPLTPAARAVHDAALHATGLRLLVSLGERRLYVLDGRDTARVARVGVGMDSTIRYEGRVWHFQTPRGVRRVQRKEADPVWVPPDWHYVEAARARGLRLVRLPIAGTVTVDDSTAIEVRGDTVDLLRAGSGRMPFAANEEVIWQGTLYMPPVGTPQRRVLGELGRYRLDLGDGYLLHGTPHRESVGAASSHGCMRLDDGDIAWLYAHAPVGTPVYTY